MGADRAKPGIRLNPPCGVSVRLVGITMSLITERRNLLRNIERTDATLADIEWDFDPSVHACCSSCWASSWSPQHRILEAKQLRREERLRQIDAKLYPAQ